MINTTPAMIVEDQYLMINDVNWGPVVLQSRADRFAWYSHAKIDGGNKRRQSGYFATTGEAIDYATRKGMEVKIVTKWINAR